MSNFSQSGEPQVFISFRGKYQRGKFVSILTSELKKSNINVFTDERETRGSPTTILFQRIRESRIALVVFSNKYPESQWCLDELVEIKKQMETKSIVPIPVFYNMKAQSVKKLSGPFLTSLLKTEDNMRKQVDRRSHKSILETEAKIWERRQALVSVGGIMGVSQKDLTDEEFTRKIVNEVKDRTEIEKHLPEAVMSFLKVKKSDLEDLTARPTSNHINGTDHQVFLDLNSLENPILVHRLRQRGQAGKCFLVLLGSLKQQDYNHEGFAFKPLLFPKKPGNNLIVSSQETQDQSCPIPVQVTNVVANRFQAAESNDNLQHLPSEDNNSNDAFTFFSFICDFMKSCAKMISPTPRKVFISLGEKQLRRTLLSSLKKDLESDGILVVYLEDGTKEMIKESSVAIVFFSAKYPESLQCLDELVKIKKLMDLGKIHPFPIFYNLEAKSVTEMKGWFLNRLLKIEDQVRRSVNRDNDNSILDTEARIWGWRQALISVASRPGLSCCRHSSDDTAFVSEVVTKVKEQLQLASRETPKKPVSYATTDHLIVEKSLLHRPETAAAEITTVKSSDGDLFYSLTSLLQAFHREISDFEGFNEIHNGLVSLCLKGHSNLVFLTFNSLGTLDQFQRSDKFELLKRCFSWNPSGVRRLEEKEPSLFLELESNQLQLVSDSSLIVSSQDRRNPYDTNLAANMF